jgi:hypothetical protein
MRLRLVVYAVLLSAWAARPAAAAPPAAGTLAVAADGDTVAVTSSFGGGWKAVVDRKRGGVITEFRLPADGANIVSNDGSRFEGFFNTVYVDYKVPGKKTGKTDDYIAKGSLYYFGAAGRLRVLEQGAERVVVEVEGKGGNQVAPKADVIRYRQRYTFLADRVVCDGELEWLFDDVVPGSHPQLLQMQCVFTPGAVAGEMRVWGADGKAVELPQTNSKGANYPPGIDYPLTVEVPLQGGRALHIRSLEMPAAHRLARFYYNEFPRQIDNKRGFGFKAWEGWPGNGAARFGKDEIIRYRYEVALAARP